MKINKLDGQYVNPSCYCIECKHLVKWSCEIAVCKAFPEGIPLEVWNSFDNICESKNGCVYTKDESYDEYPYLELNEDI